MSTTFFAPLIVAKTHSQNKNSRNRSRRPRYRIKNRNKNKNRNRNYVNVHPHSPSNANVTYSLPKKNRKRCGVIAFYYDVEQNQFYYIFVNKRYSIGYIELLLGHYQLDNLGLLVRLIEDTTLPERQLFLTEKFADLYLNFWGRWDPSHKEKFRNAKFKFEALREGYYQNNYLYSWSHLIANAQSQFSCPVKEFPKGRKKKAENQESDFDCSIREFSEETGCLPSSYVLIPYTKPFVTKIVGMDGCIYENLFYVVKFHKKDDICSRTSSETTGACWLTYEEALAESRPHEESQRTLLKQVHTHLTNLYARKLSPPS